MQDNEAWSLYWQNNVSDSFLAAPSEQHRITLFWLEFASGLPNSAKVIDLATGNGTVVSTLASEENINAIIGVDYANISPQIKPVERTSAHTIEFQSNVDIGALPFDDETIDGVTSQFGFEYANVNAAAKELVRVLKSEGKFQLLVHHQSSEIIKTATRRRSELGFINDNQLLAHTLNYIEDKIDDDTFEQVGKEYLAKYQGQLSEEISGNVFSLINQCISLKKDKLAESVKLHNQLNDRISGECSRLDQLLSVAMDKNTIKSLIQMLANCGSTATYTPFLTDDELVLGWKVQGSKC